jgi:hypothetical protein
MDLCDWRRKFEGEGDQRVIKKEKREKKLFGKKKDGQPKRKGGSLEAFPDR